jgi:hypothetical protein
MGGGVAVKEDSSFTMKGGTIYGNASVANAGDNANETRISGVPVNNTGGAAIGVSVEGVAKWGTGGAYTKGGVSQTGGSDIGESDKTLIATP